MATEGLDRKSSYVRQLIVQLSSKLKARSRGAGLQDGPDRALAGGQIDAEGNITELGKITTGMLEIGKNGYLIALQNAGAV